MATKQILTNVIKIMLIFLAAIVVLVIISVFILIPMIIKGNVVEVPNVKGKSLAESINILQGYHLNVKIDDSYKATSIVPEGYVVEQNPPPGFKVKQDKSIVLVLSSGSEKGEVPDLTGKLFSDVDSDIASAGFQIGIKSTVHSDNYPVMNTIIAQTPLPKSIYARGTKINFLLSKGAYPKMLLMPDLKGMKFNDIQERLKRSGLISQVTFNTNSIYGDGVILAQIPPAGQFIQFGQKVELQVSSSTGVISRAQRPVVIEYTVTPGGIQPKRVRIILKDSKGTRQIVDDLFQPGKTITQLDSVIGEATMIVYEDDMEHPIKTKEL